MLIKLDVPKKAQGKIPFVGFNPKEEEESDIKIKRGWITKKISPFLAEIARDAWERERWGTTKRERERGSCVDGQ